MSNSGPSLVCTRMSMIVFALVLAGLGLAVRFFYIQIVQHDHYLATAQKIYTRTTPISGRWGEIFDRDGNLLVGNMPCVLVKCAPCNIPDDEKNKGAKDRIIRLVVKYFGKDYGYYYRRFEPKVLRLDHKTGTKKLVDNQYCLVANYADMQVVEAFKKELVRTFQTDEERKDGKTTAKNMPRNVFAYDIVSKRTYPKGKLLSNVLGYSNVADRNEIKPQEGLERRMKKALAPIEGKERYERALGGSRLVYGNSEVLKKSHDGKNVYLTISEPIQAIVEEELDAVVAEWNPASAYAVVADPKTGNILAIAQRPTFNPNDRKTFKPGAISTRIAMDVYEPGSVMKPFVVGKALDWKYITPQTEFYCEKNSWFFAGWRLSDTRDYGTLTTTGVITKSSNIGTAKIAVMLGKEKTYNVLKMFGFGTRTNLPLPSESRGRFPHYKNWEEVQVSRIPIGYTMNTTLLQITRAYCALANGGKMPQLRLIDRTSNVDGSGEVTEPYAPQVQLFERKEAHEQLVDMLITVTEKGGTATRAAIPGYKVAGKTGTSRKGYSRKGFSGFYYTSFAGFVPAKDPKIVMTIMVDSPKGRRPGGGSVAAPVFARAAERILKYMNVPADPELLSKKRRR